MTDNLKYVGRQLGILLLILFIALIVFAAGLMIGYSVLGDGANPWDILSTDTWNQVISKLTGNG